MNGDRGGGHERGAASSLGVVGAYVWRVREDRWWWSEGLYRLHGFERGEVVPTTGLLIAHTHRDDAEKLRDTLSAVLRHGGAYSCYHRIVDARCRVRTVVVVGEATCGADGSVTGLRGFVADVTGERREDLRDSIESAVEGVTRHRAAIEQAKGALMLAYGIDAEGAFSLLRRCSEHANVKVNVMAERLVSLMPEERRHGSSLGRLLAVSAGLSPREVQALTGVDGPEPDDTQH